MKRKRDLPGSREALEDIRLGKMRLSSACRVLQSFVRDALWLVKQCECYQSQSNFSSQINITALNISLSIQDITRAGNSASRALKRFQKTNEDIRIE